MRRAAALAVALIALGAAPARAAGAARLPDLAVPIHYDLTITPDLAAETFRGTVAIDVDVRTATDRLVLNAHDLAIERAELVDEPDAQRDAPPRAMVDAEAQTVTLAFARPLAVGRHRVAIAYDGTIQHDRPYGLFTMGYDTAQGKRRMLATQFEPADARRLLPCWDEPAFKASFTVTAVVPAAFTVVSNMPAARSEDLGTTKRVTFAETPKMSSYLLALAAGDLETITTDVDGVRVGVVMTAGNAEKGRFALAAAAELLRYYNDYFGLAYPLPKLDLIALPGAGGFGAMENWGAITFFERLLLFDPSIASDAHRQEIYAVIAHEMAHQWFGDLVTMGWWDELWLNEGFASWMQNRAADRAHPEWQIWLGAQLARDFAMRRDARGTTHPIVQPVATVNQAAQAFDSITYSKGQAVIRMIEAYLGETAFRAGLRRYVREHAYGTATTDELWAALEAETGTPIARIAHSFTEQPGVPRVDVETRCRAGVLRIDLRQARFAVHDPAAAPLAWAIPVALAVPDRRDPVALQLDGAARVVAGACGPAVVNAGAAGYYRTAYAPAPATALARNVAALAPADRLTLLADRWALVQARQAPVDGLLDMIDRLGDAPDRAVWQNVLGTLGAIDQLEQGLSGRAAFRRAARAMLAPLAARLGWEAVPGEPTNTGALREAMLQALGDLGDAGVIDAARRRFGAAQAGGAPLPAALREPVLHIVGHYADADTFEQLHRLARETTDQSEKQQYYRALGGVLDPTLAARALALSLTDELPGALASFQVVRVAWAGDHAQQAWDFARAHLDALAAGLDPLRRYRFVPELMGAFADAAHAAELRRFAAARMPADARSEAERVAEDIAFKAEQRGWLIAEVDRWVAARPSRP
ncbi:MAG TPA: M1 family metallopeptidase [Candidatus Sulfotelmatobacter sp.]|nr:M1 family metallopeptidase [Candidatus Sulfotelmatobacter sp.]